MNGQTASGWEKGQEVGFPLRAFEYTWTPAGSSQESQRPQPRRSGRVAEGGGLENRCTREGTVGSNPTSSAMFLNLLKTKQLAGG